MKCVLLAIACLATTCLAAPQGYAPKQYQIHQVGWGDKTRPMFSGGIRTWVAPQNIPIINQWPFAKAALAGQTPWGGVGGPAGFGFPKGLLNNRGGGFVGGAGFLGGFPGGGFPGMSFPGMGFPGMGFSGGGFPGMGFPGIGLFNSPLLLSNTGNGLINRVIGGGGKYYG